MFHKSVFAQMKKGVLRSYPKVLLAGHSAFLTDEALQGIADTTIANLDGWSK